jgi:D-xylose transport system ATP-binding protein
MDEGGDTRSNGTPLLQLRGIRKNFGAVEALKGVDFEVFPGEVVALVGDNGAGKSTMIKIVSGTYAPSAGEILIAGQPVVFHSPRDANMAGIETVYQDLALCDNLDVVANLFLGRETVHGTFPGIPMSEAEMEKKSLSVLQTLHIRIPSVRSAVGALSGGQRQSIAVGRAVLWGSRLVLLDEPTAALGVAQQREVLDLILRLKRQGLAVVVISHNLEHVFEVADRIVVLRLGQRVASVRKGEVSHEAIVGYITGARAAMPVTQA